MTLSPRFIAPDVDVIIEHIEGQSALGDGSVEYRAEMPEGAPDAVTYLTHSWLMR
ncbi:MAG: hypothetical protein VYA30_16215 [Myxococcota bacterium]|nr:hypothetical protein [Myxococcota bacterium]